MRFGEALWEASPVLEKHFKDTDDKIITFSVPHSTVLAQIEAHRNGDFPDKADEFPMFLSLLAVSSELGLEDSTSKCVIRKNKYVRSRSSLKQTISSNARRKL